MRGKTATRTAEMLSEHASSEVLRDVNEDARNIARRKMSVRTFKRWMTGSRRRGLCVIEERVVGNDNTVAWVGRRLQLPESRLRPHFVRAKVPVRSYPEGTVAIDLGPHRLAPIPVRGSSSSPPPTQPVWQRARRRQGVAWQRRSQARGRRDSQP